MKLNKLFLLAAMGLGLFACNNNDLVEGSGPNGTQEEGTTYVGLKINFNSSSSRATGDQPVDGDGTTTPPLYDDVEEEFTIESAVKDVRIVVTDAEGNSQYNAIVAPDDDIYLIKITPGIKKFYAVVNGQSLGLDDQFSSWAGEQKKLLEMEASKLYHYTDGSKGNGFLMSSVAAVEQTIQDNVSQEDVIAEKANNVEITVERVVAKVTMQLKTGIDFSKETATLKKLTCQIGNANNLEYNKDGEDNAAKYKTVGTYLMAYNNDNNVRETPYFYYPNASMDWDGFSQANLLDPTPQTIYTDEQATTTSTARFYCLENTHANTGSKNYLQSNTTFIRVKAEMIPNSAKTFTYVPASGDDAQASITIADKEETGWPTTLGTFYVITAAPDQDDQGSYVFASDLVGLYADLVPNGQETDEKVKVEAVVNALATHGYYFTEPYINGCGYYNIWVNDMVDDNDQYLNIAPIFRNDWYDLTINSITLPGSPNESLDPGQPIHPNTNVGITLTVRNWNKVNHNVNLQ